MPQLILSFLALECPDKWSEFESFYYKVVDRLRLSAEICLVNSFKRVVFWVCRRPGKHIQ